MGEDKGRAFASARLQSTINGKYDGKTRKLVDGYKLIKLYVEAGEDVINDDIRVQAQNYFYSANGINNYEKIDPSEVSDDRVLNCINGIKQNSTQIFVDFYKSYKNKIDKNYFQEYVDNAFRDLQVAYRLYCLANNIEINPNISIEEIRTIIEKNDTQKVKE